MTFSHLALGMGNGQVYSQLFGLGIGIKNKFPTCGIGNGNKKIIPQILKWDIASHVPKCWECNWKI